MALLLQSEIARSINVARGNFPGWRQGRPAPTGSALILLVLIAKQPSVVPGGAARKVRE